MRKYFNYYKICNSLLKNLPERTKTVIESRFGLKGSAPRTLESIGREYGVTRERIRQIEKEGLKIIKKAIEKKVRGPFQYFNSQFEACGGLKKEEKIISEWASSKFRNHVIFLLTLGDQYKRFRETKEFYSFWINKEEALSIAQKVINSFIKELEEKRQPISLEDYNLAFPSLTFQAISSYIEISKRIMTDPDGLYGLSEWPEVCPKNIREKAYLIFKKEKRPLHFSEVASFVGKLSFSSKEVLPQSVHNELIKDPRFVLVGRG